VPKRGATAPSPEARGIFAGLRFVARDPMLGPLVLEILVVGMFVPLLFAGLPLLAFERYGRSAVVAGALASAWSGGALGGAVADALPYLALTALCAASLALATLGARGRAAASAQPLALDSDAS
jgi:hypothetical protein